MIITFRWRVVA